MALSKQISSPKKKIPKHNKTTQPAPRTPLVCVVSLQTNKQTNKDTKNCICSETKTTKKKFVFHPLQAHPHAQSRQQKKEKEHGAHKTFMRGIIILLIIIIIIRVVVYYSSFFFAFLFCVSRCCSRIDRLRGGFRFLALRSHWGQNKRRSHTPTAKNKKIKEK